VTQDRLEAAFNKNRQIQSEGIPVITEFVTIKEINGFKFFPNCTLNPQQLGNISLNKFNNAYRFKALTQFDPDRIDLKNPKVPLVNAMNYFIGLETALFQVLSTNIQ